MEEKLEAVMIFVMPSSAVVEVVVSKLTGYHCKPPPGDPLVPQGVRGAAERVRGHQPGHAARRRWK